MKMVRYSLVVVVVIAMWYDTRPAYAATDVTPPVVTVNGTPGPNPFYPVQDGYKDTFTVNYTVSDDQATQIGLFVTITNASAGVVLQQGFSPSNPTTANFVWNGRNESDALVPAGDYTLTFTANDGTNEATPAVVPVTVSHKHLVTKRFEKTMTAAAAIIPGNTPTVGECSVLRRPSLRDWAGSLGYYSNKKCEKTFNKSLVQTIDGWLVPQAFQNRYHSLVIKLYGGAAKARPDSKALIQYLKANDDVVQAKFMGSALGTHAGARVDNARAFIRHDDFDRPYVAWGLATANGHWYDVKNFTVVLTYTKLV